MPDAHLVYFCEETGKAIERERASEQEREKETKQRASP